MSRMTEMSKRLRHYNLLMNEIPKLDIWIKKELGSRLRDYYFLTEEIYLQLGLFEDPKWFLIKLDKETIVDPALPLSFQEVFGRVNSETQQRLLYHLDLFV